MDSYYMFASIIPKISNIQDQQIRAAVYGDDIAYYADKLVRLNTYLLSAARVKDLPKSYGWPIHTFYWILDKESIVERINHNDEIEKPLPPPTKLNLTPLANVAQLTTTPSAEIDILGVVIRCGPEKYAGRTQNKCRETTIADDQNTQFLLTLWGDFSVIEGIELQAKIEKEEYPVILGRNIGISSYQGLSLQTKFNTTIRIDPSYPQAVELLSWVKSNKSILSGWALTALSSRASDSFSTSSTPLIVGIFNVEATMSISDEFQMFCVLECPAKELVLPLTIDLRIAKKARPLAASEQEMESTIIESGSSSAPLALEPLTPAKK
ncbi:putative replication protein A 70 kDa DNA-binding subunit B-like isoform X4 [Capsicum annuum]|nr:putative replication protein A 70 kDa DNA-binding subunit B-like isoform X4 [Capsicum annuum]